ncbi:MAG TPA: hypothetical protein VKP65_09610, partial [Rhodothermales bacterium]|nr:hypothetical protein [Rhodothermales bacterium]
MNRLLPFALLFLALATPTFAQQKQPLDHDVYAIWNEINEQAISDDGRWVLASMGPENEDAQLRVKSAMTDQSYHIPRGVSAQFSKNSRFVAFLIKPPKETVRQAKLDDKKGDDLPKDSLGILDVTSGEVTKVERVQSF